MVRQPTQSLSACLGISTRVQESRITLVEPWRRRVGFLEVMGQKMSFIHIYRLCFLACEADRSPLSPETLRGNQLDKKIFGVIDSLFVASRLGSRTGPSRLATGSCVVCWRACDKLSEQTEAPQHRRRASRSFQGCDWSHPAHHHSNDGLAVTASLRFCGFMLGFIYFLF